MNDNLYSFKVNIATVEDAPDIAKVTHEAFLRYKEMAGLDDVDALHETIEDVENDIRNKTVLVVKIDKKVIGTTRLEIFDDNTVYLSRFAIDEEHRNAGIGKILMRVVDRFMRENNIKCVKLHTSSKVTALIRFYYGRGFYISNVDYKRGYPRAELIKEYK